MEVILRQAVEKLGQPGDVVKVSPGTPATICCRAASPTRRRRATSSASSRSRRASRRPRTSVAAAAQALADKLEQVSLTFSARVGEEGKLFGSVTAADIAEQLARAGLRHDREAPDRSARADQGARRLSRAGPPARRREARDQGLGDQAVGDPLPRSHGTPRSSARMRQADRRTMRTGRHERSRSAGLFRRYRRPCTRIMLGRTKAYAHQTRVVATRARCNLRATRLQPLASEPTASHDRIHRARSARLLPSARPRCAST